MKTLRRYEVLLPTQYNDGTSVPDDVIGQTVLDLRKKFTATSCESQHIQGVWEFEGKEYRDELIRLFVDVADSEENRDFFTSYKSILKKRFEQLDIWITSYLIEVI